jgi:ankyrin repeat protein
MLGEAFVKEAENYCLSGEVNLPENFNLLALFRKFTEKKCDIYFKEKNEMDCSKSLAKRSINVYVEGHISLALMSLFSLDKLYRLWGVEFTSYMQRTKEFLQSGDAYRIGMITEFKDSKPRFIHRCFAEYFAAKWFTKNFIKCENFILDNLFAPSFEVIRNIFDRMLAENFKLHDAVLNNDVKAVRNLLKEKTDINIVDNGGRTALHLAASYDSIITKTLLSVVGVVTNIKDGVLKWTPLRYADRTRSWMAIDSLLQSGGNADDIVLTSCNIDQYEWGSAALRSSAKHGYTSLLDFMLNSGFDIDAFIPEFYEDRTLIHIASQFGQLQSVNFLIERGANVNIRTSKMNTALHFAAINNSKRFIKLLLDKGASVNVRGDSGNTPLHKAARLGNLRATKVLVERGAALEETDEWGCTPLVVAAEYGKIDVVRYLIKNGADINVCNDPNPLYFTDDNYRLDLMRLLLELGAEINGSNAKRGMSRKRR